MKTKYNLQVSKNRLAWLVKAFTIIFCVQLLLIFGSCKTGHLKNSDEEGFVSIFNGKTLEGWDGDPVYWKVRDGILVGEVTPSTLLKRNSFIIWRGGQVSDFELKVDYRVSKDGNSGINYRSEDVKGIPHALRGYQADLDGAQRYTGMNYEERRRTTIASRGEKVILSSPSTNPDSLALHIENNRWLPTTVIGSLGTKESLASKIRDEDWNEYHLIVKGNRLLHKINGVLMSDVTDNDKVNRRQKGLLGVQVHVGPPMKIEYRNFRLKKLK
jgi:hypothetical protein